MSKMLKSCHICRKNITSKQDFNYIDSDSKKFSPREELNSLGIKIINSSPYICLTCKKLLQKRQQCRFTLADANKKLDELIKANSKVIPNHHLPPMPVFPSQSLSVSQSPSDGSFLPLKSPSPITSPPPLRNGTNANGKTATSLMSPQSTPLSKIPLSPSDVTLSSITSPRPMKNATSGNETTICLMSPPSTPLSRMHLISPPPEVPNNKKVKLDHQASTEINLKVFWPSGQIKDRKIDSSLNPIALALLKENPKSIAKSVWSNKNVREQLIPHFLKEIEKESTTMCQNRTFSVEKMEKVENKSIFKKTSKEDLLNFTFNGADEEMKQRCPLFREILKTVSLRTGRSEEKDLYWQSTIVTAAAVCFKNRSNRMTALQQIITSMVQHSSYTVNK